MRTHTSRAIRMLSGLMALTLSFGVAEAKGRPTNVPNPPCDAASSVRLSIVNQCSDGLWVVITPPGDPSQIAVKAQWDWVNAYVTRENKINTGGKGSISDATPTTLTITVSPNPAFVAGMKILIKGAKPSGEGDLTTTITNVSSSTITLADRAGAVMNADLWYYDGQSAFQIAAGHTQGLCVPKKGAPSGNFRFFMGCPSLTHDADPFAGSSCIIGSAIGDGAGINTLFEPSFGCMPPLTGSQCAFNASSCRTSPPNGTNCDPLTATDFFDISAVDGYTFPMRVDAQGSGCSAPSKDASMLDLASCPAETGTTLFANDPGQQALINQGISLLTQDATYLKSCAAPYKWFTTTGLGTPSNPTLTNASCTSSDCNAVGYYAGHGCANAQHCPGGSGPQQKVGPRGDGTLAVQNTRFVQQLRALGYTGYTWQYDDGVGGQACDAGAIMTVTLCPSGGQVKPYLKKPLWTFSTSTGTCTTDGSTGDPDGHMTFGSLFACQKANMRYTCTDLTEADPFKLPIGVWAANAVATVTPTSVSRTYEEFQQEQQLICENTPELLIPAGPEFGGGTVSVPNCTYYAAMNPAKRVCPVP